MTIYYGWYSEQQSQLTGTCIYAECNTGNEIELTEVNIGPSSSSMWPDKVFVGMVNYSKLLTVFPNEAKISRRM